jgi:hypothetical protein
MSSGLISRVTSSNRWTEKQISKGLCTHCNSKPVEGKKMCRKHLNYYNTKRQEYVLRHKDL